jgi:hypothetical protein
MTRKSKTSTSMHRSLPLVCVRRHTVTLMADCQGMEGEDGHTVVVDDEGDVVGHSERCKYAVCQGTRQGLSSCQHVVIQRALDDCLTQFLRSPVSLRATNVARSALVELSEGWK